MAFLHAHNIETEAIFSSNFITLREMVNLLILVKSFILETFASSRRPENIPFMTFCGRKALIFNYGSDHFVVKAHHFIKEFWVLNMIAFLISIVRKTSRLQLFFSDVLKDKRVTLILILTVVETVTRVTCLRVEPSLTWYRGPICGRCIASGHCSARSCSLIF
jgi:hypothetical protein